MTQQLRKNFLIKILVINIALNSLFILSNTTPSCAKNTINKQAVIDNINNVYNKYPVIKSKFKQEDNSNNINYGWFIIDKKNGKARIDYENLPLRIIVNNNSLMVEQIDLNEKTFTPLIGSPLKYIVSNNTNINNKDITINNVSFNNNLYTLNISSQKSAFKGHISLIFDSNYFLRSWIIYDEVGNTTKVTLLNTEYLNIKVPSNIFNTHRITNINISKLK